MKLEKLAEGFQRVYISSSPDTAWLNLAKAVAIMILDARIEELESLHNVKGLNPRLNDLELKKQEIMKGEA